MEIQHDNFKLHDRAIGSVLGLAVGDALGATLEFSLRDQYPLLTEIVGGGPFELKAGQWTDDTSMALALAESLLSCRGLEETDLMNRFLDWHQTGAYSCNGKCFDIGNTTRDALMRFKETGDPVAGNTSTQSAGNGSLMRLSPVVVRYFHDRPAMADAARRQSMVTHGATEAVPEGNTSTSTSSTSIDREVADSLLYLEKAKQLRFGALPGRTISSAPRLSVIMDGAVQEFYGSSNESSLLEGALSDVTHQHSCPTPDSWLGQSESQIREIPSPFSEATANLEAFRFSPGDKRSVASIFQTMAGRKVKIVVEDPWCGVRPQNRKKLADFLGALERSGIVLQSIAIVWNPYADDFETPKTQESDLEKQLTIANIKCSFTFERRDKRSGHFHDRVVLMETIDGGNKVSGRWDITSGIDNLMSSHKECKVFMEIS